MEESIMMDTSGGEHHGGEHHHGEEHGGDHGGEHHGGEHHDGHDEIRFFYGRPRVRKRRAVLEGQAEEPMHEDWMELVLDLCLVAFLLKLGDYVKYCGADFWTFLWAANTFFIVFRQCLRVTYYFNLYISEDLFRVIMVSLVIIGVFLASLATSHNSHHGEEKCEWIPEYQFNFYLGLMLAYLGQALLAFQAAYYEPIGWGFAYGVARVMALSTGVCLLQMYMRDIHIWAMVILNILDVVALGNWGPIFRRMRDRGGQFWVHIGHLSARYGIYVMITLGESVIQLVVEDLTVGDWKLWRHSGFSVGSLIICLGLALAYFYTQPHGIENNVLRKSASRALLSHWAHTCLYFTLFLVGVGLKILLYFYVLEVNNKPPSKIRWTRNQAETLVAISLAFSSILISVIQQLHPGFETLSTKARVAYFVLRILLGLSYAFVPFERTGSFLRVQILITLLGTLIDVLANQTFRCCSPEVARREVVGREVVGHV